MRDGERHGSNGEAVHAADLTLTASCEDVLRSMRFLTGAMRSCGAVVLSRQFDPEGGAEMEVEFRRVVCVEIYCILVATGLEMDRDSHLRLTGLCQCTWELLPENREKPVRVTMRLREPAVEYASYGWMVSDHCREIYEA